MNSKVTTHSQLSTTKPKTHTHTKQTRQTTRTGRESQKWRSHGGLSVGREREDYGGKRYREQEAEQLDTKQTGKIKNNMENGEAKEFICMTHGHELRQGMLDIGALQCRGE